MTYRIAVIGAGSLGSRHLQGLAKLDRPARIVVVDPDGASLRMAGERWAQVSSKLGSELIFASNIGAIDGPIDTAIVATNSDVRAAVVRKLLDRVPVRTMVLEKVLFGRPEDYSEIGALLAGCGTRAWVNCPRRAWPDYAALAERLAHSTVREVHVTGSDWGLCCNSIHMLDFIAWLSGQYSYAVHETRFDDHIRPSKRRGFVEMTGTFAGSFAGGPCFRISSWASTGRAPMPFTLQVFADDLIYIAREDEGLAWIADADSGWAWKKVCCRQVLQSDLTHLILDRIVREAEVPLPRYDQSAALHKPMIAMFMQHLAGHDPSASLLECPIT